MGLRILITNITLASRSGTETYVRDLAIELLKRGHTPIVYSPQLRDGSQTGSIVEELHQATVPVVDRLENIAEPPDIIHGHHHPVALAALLHFPHAPAIFVCHSWTAWFDEPPLFPRVQYYVAVSHTILDRLVLCHGIPAEQAKVIHNAVDLQRFKPRSPLPSTPKRALVFSNYANAKNYLRLIQIACEQVNLPLDVVGVLSGSGSDEPETILGNYDLVFAKGRCAIEALAVGTAVVVAEEAGFGGLVTSDNLDHFRRLNFGMRSMQQENAVELLLMDIRRYNADDAMNVSARIRAIAGLDAAVDQLLALYAQAIERHSSCSSNPDAEQRAIAAYLNQWYPKFGHYEGLKSEFTQLSSTHDQLQREAEATQMHAALLQKHADWLQENVDRLQENFDQLQKHADWLQENVDQLQKNSDSLNASYTQLQEQSQGLQFQLQVLKNKHKNRQRNNTIKNLQFSFAARLRTTVLKIPFVGQELRLLYRALIGKRGR